MALINNNTKINFPFSLRVKEFYWDSDQQENGINQWLEENEDKYDFIDIKLISCQYKEG